jgi:hypothetical protein
MPATGSLLMREFLTWVDRRRRTYAEAMEAWRSSCPRHTVWEDALADGLIEVEGDGPMHEALVTLTAQGKVVLFSRFSKSVVLMSTAYLARLSTKEPSMDLPRLVNEFRGLPSASQIETLVRLAHELTIVGRDAYEPGSLELRHPERMRSLNEIQHRVTSHVLALLAADASRYPDDLLVSIILGQDDPELRRQVAAAFARSLSPQTVI